MKGNVPFAVFLAGYHLNTFHQGQPLIISPYLFRIMKNFLNNQVRYSENILKAIKVSVAIHYANPATIKRETGMLVISQSLANKVWTS